MRRRSRGDSGDELHCARRDDALRALLVLRSLRRDGARHTAHVIVS